MVKSLATCGLLLTVLCARPVFAQSATAPGVSLMQPDSQPSQRQIQNYLTLAQQAANRLSSERDGQNESPRTFALQMVAATALDARQFTFARSVIATMPQESRSFASRFLVISLARDGRIDEAIQEAQKLDRPPWVTLAKIVAQSDLSKGLEIAARAPAESRQYSYADIIRQQVLAGNFGQAGKVADLLLDRDKKAEQVAFIALAKLIDGPGDLKQLAQEHDIDLTKQQENLAAILEFLAQAGRLDEARRVLAVMTASWPRAQALQAIAERQLKEQKLDEAVQTVRLARKELSALDDEKPTDLIAKASGNMSAAMLLAKAGRMDEAVNCMEAAKAAGEREKKVGLGIVEAMGSKAALAMLLIAAGRLEEGKEAARQEDGKTNPQVLSVLASAYAAAGRQDKVKELLAQDPTLECRVYVEMASMLVERQPDPTTKPATNRPHIP